jgi:membrane dipeptidase
MRYADFMGFLLTQKELMTKAPDAKFDSANWLDLCHVTVAPPFAKTVEAISAEFDWLRGIAASQDAQFVTEKDDLDRTGLKLVGGLQYPPEDVTLADLKRFREQGILFSTLAYAEESPFGGGFATPDAPLTEKGKTLILNMAEAGMVLDLAHAGWRTAREALDFIDRGHLWIPVAASHTGCAAVYNFNRNLPDDVLVRIAGHDGFVGIATLTFMLDEKDNRLEPFYAHLAHALELLGTERVAIGSDGIYKQIDLEEQGKIFAMMKERIDPKGIFRARFPDQPVKLNSPARMIKLAVRLLDFGIKAETVKKVVGENLFRFLSEVL